jgi:hypothetical protein
VQWTDNAPGIPHASIRFTKKGNRYEAMVQVKAASGDLIVENERLIFKNATGVGAELALRLFGKGGAIEFD